ncbi:MAG: hypothetical protein GEU80_01385 [Dehalococcoidia bacterium]|nr:hypothetical protein [Dehalococcoidia bacterium]
MTLALGTRHPRRYSAMMLVLPPLLLIAAPLTVLLATDVTPTPEQRGTAIVVAALPVVTPIFLRVIGLRWDPLLLAPAWVLCALGLTVIARVQPDLLERQLLWITLGWAAFIALVGFPPLIEWLRRYRYTWLTAAVLLALSTLFFGDDVTGQGTRLWLRIGPLTMQPAELLRVLLIVFLAAYLSERTELLFVTWRRLGPLSVPPPAYWLPLLGMVGLAVMVVVAQRDFGPSVIYVATFLAMLYLATGRRAAVLTAILIFAGAALLAYGTSDRIQGRVEAWLDPWADAQGAGYQSLQAIGGLAFGGVTGAGPGWGYPGLIPAAHTDYPLAVIGEEWGLLGTLAVIALYTLLTLRALARSREAGDRFAQLLSAGLAVSLAVQVLVVLGGVLRLVPLTGITSPFFSYGGSSMLMGWVMLALLLRARAPGATEPARPLRRPPLPAIDARNRRVGLALLLGFLVLAGALGYWQVVRAADLSSDPAVMGERLNREAARVTRGRILDRNGEVLAETVRASDGTVQRQYHDPGAVHVLGFNSPRLGAAGAEAAAADDLMGRTQRTPLDTARDLLHLDREGADVRLTIDADLQRVAEEAMGGATGAAVALDPRSGDVLALVSNPTFAPDFSEEEWTALRNDPRSPLLNRATQGLYTPGSTFKTVTLAAGVEYGLVGPDSPAECPEQIFIEGVSIVSRNEPPGQRTEDVTDAYAYSCNTFFAQLGVELGEGRFTEMSGAFGLTEAVPFELPTAAGRLSSTPGFLGRDAGLAASAFGQGELQVTPLHLALVTAAVANGGEVPEPRLFLDDRPSTWRRAMLPSTARAVAAMMERGVEAGWASTAAIPGVRVAGKTGSAEVAPDDTSHALFIAFAPVDDPQIAVAVVKERAGSGSQQAGPVARAIMEAWLSRDSGG